MAPLKKNTARLIFLIFLFSQQICSGQFPDGFYLYNRDTDSMISILEAASGEDRIKLMVNIAFQFFQAEQYVKALEWLDQAEEAGDGTDQPLRMYYVYYLKALCSDRMEQYESAISNWQRSLEIAIRSGITEMEENCMWKLVGAEWKFHKNPEYGLIVFNHIKDGIYFKETLGRLIKLYNLGQFFGQAKLFRVEQETFRMTYEMLFDPVIYESISHAMLFTLLMQPGKYEWIHGRFPEAISLFQLVLEDLHRLNQSKSSEMDIHSRIYNAISRTYLEWGMYDSALIFQRKAIDSYNDSPLPRMYCGIIDLSNYLEGTGYAYLHLESYDSAVHYFTLSREIRIRISDELGIAMSDDGLGETHLILGNYHNSLELLDSSLHRKLKYLDWWISRISYNFENKRTRETIESIALTKRLLGNLYRDWEKFDISIDMLEGSLQASRDAGDEFGEVLAFGEMGRTYVRMGDFDRAKDLFLKGLSLSEDMDIKVQRGRILQELSNLYLLEGDTTQFLSCSEQAEEIFKDACLRNDLAAVMKDLGLYWLTKGSWEKALSLLTSSLEITDATGIKKISMECCQGLFSIYKELDSLGPAWHYMNRFTDLSREIYSLEAMARISEIDAVYQLNEREEELQRVALENELQELRLRQNQYVMISLGALLIMIVLFFILILRNNRLKMQHKMILLERRLLRSQMNPHFIFNALTNIQESIFKNDPIKASKYLNHFSKLIRTTLECTREEYVPLQSEIELVNSYLELQQLRHDSNFDFEIDVDEEIDPESLFIPPMLTQPFIENAVEHGIRHKKDHGHIRIEFRMNDPKLHFMVEDDGIGREAASRVTLSNGKLHRSMASQITIERLQMLNRKSRVDQFLHISDLYNESGLPAGTRVEFNIPVAVSNL
jgi:tetratricopeptide (TPR) repeat protein